MNSSKSLLPALLGLTCVLLVAHLVIALFGGSPAPTAYGQAVGEPSGRFILATGVDQAGNLPVAYVLDTQAETLALYQTTKTGIELAGFRPLEWDLKLREEVPAEAQKKRFSVAKTKARVQAYRP